MQKYIAFLYKSNEKLEFEIKIIIPFTLVSKKGKRREKYLGINLATTKNTCIIYVGKYKILIK